MATQLDTSAKDDLKTQFVTREGTYRLLTLSEYSRPNRVGYTNSQNSPQVRVSVVSLPNSTNSATTPMNANTNNNNNASTSVNLHNIPNTSVSNTESPPPNGSGDGSTDAAKTSSAMLTLSEPTNPSTLYSSIMNGTTGIEQASGSIYQQIYGGDRICFNFGRELYVYAFRGVKKGNEMSKPIDKKFYKGTNPSCHDFNACAATPTGAPLLVGFTTGQIQLILPQPGPREMRKLFNEERLIDRTKVTCLKWLPKSTNLFLVSHASGHLYLYNEDLPCSPPSPNYQPFKVGNGYTIYTCKSKSTRNPLYKWIFDTDNCCINEFCFSPCGSNLAIVSQDGFLRVFHYDTMELLGIARSYFGGFLCVCWSPDGKYIVVGGEDDLVTVWSLHERRVVARGQGHRSWVSVVAFDPYTTSYTNWESGEFSDDENQMNDYMGTRESRFSGDSTAHNFDFSGINEKNFIPNHSKQRPHSASFRSNASSVALPPDKLAISYRLGSVSQDTQICLWDITEDVLRNPMSLRQKVNSVNLNDTTFMNGGVDGENVNVIRPIAMGNTSGSVINSFSPPQHASSPIKDLGCAEYSNSSSSKFSTANCTMSSQSLSADTPPDENIPVNGISKAVSSNNSIKFSNCIGKSSKSDSIDGKNSSTTFYTSGYNSKSSNSSNKSSDSGLSAFNSLTHRLTNFSFLGNSDKKSSTPSANPLNAPQRSHRKTLNLLKSYNGGSVSNNNNNHHENNVVLNSSGVELSNATGPIKLAKLPTNLSSSPPTILTSYDPMKLIGTPSCPRFDECPLLEPLVCKKIAHERLSALIFREDCFLTACQDGFIYTWARPGYSSNIPQHISPTQSAPSGGTII